MKKKTVIFQICILCVCLNVQAVEYTTDVFIHGQEGYPEYRIPSIVTSNKGTLLAFAEGRGSLSDHAENDIVLKRSTDGGRTWAPLQVVAEQGGDNLNNPQAVVLPDTGRILMMYQIFPKNYHARSIGKKVKLARPGLSGRGVQKCYTTFSDDDGLTWSKPVDITRSRVLNTPMAVPILIKSTSSIMGIKVKARKSFKSICEESSHLKTRFVVENMGMITPRVKWACRLLQ